MLLYLTNCSVLYTFLSRQAFAHSKQLSRTPTEVVAESFCHLFTVPAEKLTELRAFYGYEQYNLLCHGTTI